MNEIELSKKLASEKISKSLYSLDGGLPNEKVCLDYYNGKWIVYYSERGCRTGLTEFIHEYDACLFIYDKIKLISTRKVR